MLACLLMADASWVKCKLRVDQTWSSLSYRPAFNTALGCQLSASSSQQLSSASRQLFDILMICYDNLGNQNNAKQRRRVAAIMINLPSEIGPPGPNPGHAATCRKYNHLQLYTHIADAITTSLIQNHGPSL